MSLEKTASEIDALPVEEVLPPESLGEGGVRRVARRQSARRRWQERWRLALLLRADRRWYDASGSDSKELTVGKVAYGGSGSK